MKIHIPNSAFLGNIDHFLRSFETVQPKKLEITANKKWISVHPVVLTMVGALGLTFERDEIHCEKLEAISKHYLERMHLFKLLKISSGIRLKAHEAAGRFIPLTQIQNSQELTECMKELIPLLHLEPHQAEPIRYVISELVRNVLEHAQSPNGALLCAQYYAKSNVIRIGIADIGVGIKQTITRSHSAATDLDAIRLALMPGITGMTAKEGGTEFNAGAGLFFIRSIAKVNRNFLMIYSGKAMYKLLKSKGKKALELQADPYRERYSAGEDYPLWQGTVVGIDISLDATEQFSVLLDRIRETYIQTIRERKKEKYRQPRFI